MSAIQESVRRKPAPSLLPFVEWYAGFRQAGLPRPGTAGCRPRR